MGTRTSTVRPERRQNESARRQGNPVTPVGRLSLKDAMNEALRDWVATVRNTFYVIGTVAGPPSLSGHGPGVPIGDGDETREQILEREGRLPMKSSPVSAAGAMPWHFRPIPQ